ncbi:hypothetical protein FH5_03392 [Priestia endophytica]|nr:hypothetical protein FH5_03392 [Priestia endophytica]
MLKNLLTHYLNDDILLLVAETQYKKEVNKTSKKLLTLKS